MASTPAPRMAKLLPITIFASIANAPPVCCAAVAEADGLLVFVVEPVAVELGIAVVLADGTVIPIAAQIWAEIVTKAGNVSISIDRRHLETHNEGRL
jgi:hypothetical protein